MSERDLDARLDAVERALTDDDTDLDDLRETAEAVGDVADLESRVADLEARIDELEAGLQAVRGYAGNVRAVNREVERRASAALAKAETLEAAVEDDGIRAGSTSPDRSVASGTPNSSGSGESAESRAARPHSESAPSQSQSVRSQSQSTHSQSAQSQTPRPSPQTGRAEPPTGESPTGAGADSRVDADLRADGDSRTGQRASDSRQDGRAGKRPRGDADGARDGSEAESQTEQFIERVRDAL